LYYTEIIFAEIALLGQMPIRCGVLEMHQVHHIIGLQISISAELVGSNSALFSAVVRSISIAQTSAFCDATVLLSGWKSSGSEWTMLVRLLVPSIAAS
jgi:hypothetical protein